MLKLVFMVSTFSYKSSRNKLANFSTTIEVNTNVKKVLKLKKNKKRLFKRLCRRLNWFNIVRGLPGNIVRYYYYNRLPMIFRYYPYMYRYWVLKKVMLPLLNKRASKIWRKKLHRRNKRLGRLRRFLGVYKQELILLNRRIAILLRLKNKGQSQRNKPQQFVSWYKVLNIKVLRQNMFFNKYKKYLHKYTQRYFFNKPLKKRPRSNIVKTHVLNKLSSPYMLHIKFYKTQQLYYHFRFYKYKRRHNKRMKWFFKKRLKKSLKTQTFRIARTSLYVNKRIPYRLRKRTRAYKYKRFSYYWLRYFFKRFKQIYIDNKKAPTNYNDIKKYLLCWLMKVRSYKFLSLHSVNPARGFLLYKSNKLQNDIKQYGLFKSYENLTFLHDRNEIDDMFKSLVRKNRYLYRNFYWRFYKSTLERRKAQILKRNYHYTWGLRPYIFVHKKQKVFYNWADRHIFKRFPLHRYKYTAFFKFPRFADYRRLFKNQLREQHVFRYLYRLKLGQLIKAFRKATYKTKRIFELMFLKYFELRLDTVVHRLNFAWSLKHARQLVLRGFFVVNNKVIDNHKYHVGLGDVIMPIKRFRMQPLSKKYLNYVDYGLNLSWVRLFYRPIQTDQYPAHFFINERIPAGMIVNKFNPHILRFNKPYSVQFLTLSLLKYS